MWIERQGKKDNFIQAVTSLSSQVLVLRGARQVGKTSFVIKALRELQGYPQININLATKKEGLVEGVPFFGRDYFGVKEDAEELLFNLSLSFGPLQKLKFPVIVFIDEADRHPAALEAIQRLAGLSDKLKVVYTGSNLENVPVLNAATGRKRTLDLYPITFREFLKAAGSEDELKFLEQISLKDQAPSEHYHRKLLESFDLYLRLGGMPKILDTFLDRQGGTQAIPGLISDLVASIEENVKIVLGAQSRLYEYEDVLRKLAILSMDTLKFSRLQVQHAGRSEAKKLVNKTVGARVAHKVRLYEAGTDLSKYILFDAGVLNYLLNGSDLLKQKMTEVHQAIQYETVVGNEIIATLPSRDDLFYWKSPRGAQVEYLLKSPRPIAIDVKSQRGDVRSLDSAAIFEKEVELLVKVSKEPLRLNTTHVAKIPNQDSSRNVPLLVLPHYLAGRIGELVSETG